MSLKNSSSGQILKINRRNNSFYYRVYQKDNGVRFELEMKHQQTKSVQDYLFNNQLETFEHQLILKYYKCSQRFFTLDNPYTHWVDDFKRRYKGIQITYPSLLISYLQNKIHSQTPEEEERFFHLLQFLSFVKSLNIDPYKDCKTHWIKNQLYYILKFPLSQFVKFTGIHISNNSQRKKILTYFKRLQQIDPIVKEFSDGAFRSYVSFPYVDSDNTSGNSWVIEVFVAEELFYFPYPFQFTKSFLTYDMFYDIRERFKFN